MRIGKGAHKIAQPHLPTADGIGDRKDDHRKRQNADADDDRDVGVGDGADHVDVDDAEHGGDELEDEVRDIRRCRREDEGENEHPHRLARCRPAVRFLAVKGAEQDVEDEQKKGDDGKRDVRRVVVDDRRHVEIGEEDRRLLRFVERIEIEIAHTVDKVIDDLRLLRKIAHADVFGAVVLRVIVLAARDVRHVDALIDIFDGREIGVIGHHIVDERRDGAGEDALVEFGEELDRMIVVRRRLEHDDGAARAARFEVDAEADALGDVVKPRKGRLAVEPHERLGAVETEFFAVDEGEDEVVVEGIAFRHALREVVDGFEHGGDGNAVVGRALPHRHRVVVRHEEDGFPRGMLAVGGDVRDDVGEIEVLIFLVVRRIFLHLIGGSFCGVFVHKAALFEGRDDVVARRLVGFGVEERTGAVFGELFDMPGDGGSVHLRLARHFLGIRHGEGEKEDEKRTKYDVDCQDGFFHSSSIGNVRTEQKRKRAQETARGKIRSVHKRRFYHMRGGMSNDFTMARGGRREARGRRLQYGKETAGAVSWGIYLVRMRSTVTLLASAV